MNSAAVIGRQLRQQQTSSRISGPVVPPTQYKGRSQSSSLPRSKDKDSLVDSTQSNLGVDADKKFAQFSQQYPHEFYPHPAHREKGEKAVRGGAKEKKKKEPRLRLSWHCFCVALKALSSGIVLFVAGTVMSVVGFFADSLALQSVRLQNGTELTEVNTDLKTHLHNLTYVGPVIMGLGGIVIVAACVLTFEVRDTLGVKASPAKDKSSPDKSNLQMPPNGLSPVDQSKVRKFSNNTINQNDSSNHSASKSASSNHRQGSRSKARPDPKKSDNAEQKSRENWESAKHNDLTSKLSPDSGKPTTEPDTFVNSHLQSVSSQDLFSIDMSFVRIPSPQETEISDPEGCSLNGISRWKSRCSCSGSPSNSMLLALHGLETDRQRYHLPITYGTITPANGIPTMRQLPARHSKILASVESDGLSSSSSEWDIDYRLAETQQTLHRNRHLTNNLDTSCELSPNTFYFESCGQYNLCRAGGKTGDLTCGQSSRQDRVELRYKSDLYSGETTQLCYPLLRVSSVEWSQNKSHCNSQHSAV